MRITTLLLFLGSMTFTIFGNAQEGTVPGLEGPDRIARLSLIHFLDFTTPGPHLNFEHRVKGNNYLRHEIGWINDFLYQVSGGVQDVQGYRIRSGHRRYVANPGRIKRRLFREISLDFRAVEVQASDLFQLGLLGAFEQRLSYEVQQKSVGLNYIRGMSLHLGQQGRWQIDLGVGLGLSFTRREFSELPQGVNPKDVSNRLLFSGASWQYNRREGWSPGFSLPLIGAIGYQF